MNCYMTLHAKGTLCVNREQQLMIYGFLNIKYCVVSGHFTGSVHVFNGFTKLIEDLLGFWKPKKIYS